MVYLVLVLVAFWIAGETGSGEAGLGSLALILVGGWIWERHRLEQEAIRRELAALRAERAER